MNKPNIQLIIQAAVFRLKADLIDLCGVVGLSMDECKDITTEILHGINDRIAAIKNPMEDDKEGRV